MKLNEMATTVLVLVALLQAGCVQPKSAAEKRFEEYGGGFYRNNEFYTLFKYAPVTGIGYEKGVTRRDPSSIIKVGDTYYVWYTYMKGVPVGQNKQSYTKPGTPWDLASLYYATSKDGWHWEEQGPAVKPGPKGEFDDRTLCTPDILVHNGKYYLYYQAYRSLDGGKRSSHFIFGMSWADSPDGPWHRHPGPVMGITEEYDPAIHPDTVNSPASSLNDPMVVMRDGKFWMFYKQGLVGDKGKRQKDRIRGIYTSLAIADKPEGPFVKHPLNPVINSGHECTVWPYKEGLAAIVSVDGWEKNTIQYAPDGINFEIKSIIDIPPLAPGIYCADKYTDTKDGQGITWGLCHTQLSYDGPFYIQDNFLVRFECDLSQAVHRPRYKGGNFRHSAKAMLTGKARIRETDLDGKGSPKPIKKNFLKEMFARPEYDID